MADSKAKPLLPSAGSAASYDATSFRSTGRGKLRFEMRQRLKRTGRSKSVYDSVFTHHRKSLVSTEANKGGTSSKKPNELSIDQELAVEKQGSKEKPPTEHSQLYNALNPKSRTPSALLFQKFITAIILLDALIYVLSTEPGLSHLSNVFYVSEAVTSSVFALEYFARLAVCIEKRCYGKHGPIRGRWKYMLSMQALIDAFATFPFFIELVSGIPMPTLTYLRVFRLLRITRTRSYSQAMDAVGRVFYFNREILHVAALLGMYLVVVTSVLMYYLRPRGSDADGVEDASDFESIGSTMVLSILMLTGQGGPTGSLPWYTQIVVLLTGVFSVAMFAIPASMLTWGFEAEAERLGVKAKKRALARRRGEVYVSDTSTSSSNSSCVSGFGDISTSDEEYMNIIGGDDDDEGKGVQMQNINQGELQSMLGRIENLEQSVAKTNMKLDLILQKLEGR